MDLKDIKAIIDLMKKNAISEFEMEKEGFKIKLKRGGNGVLTTSPPDDAMTMASQPAAMAQPMVSPTTSVIAITESSDFEVKSPMVGTFYRAPSPESASYVEVGTELNPDTIVCIVEAMKVMNEIKAEVRGVVTQVLAENGKPVEFGQPLFKVRPL